MRRISARVGWWYVLPLAVAGALLNSGLFRRACAPMPPSPTVSEPVHEVPAAVKPAKNSHVLIISEDGLRADAIARMHLHWHDVLRQKRGSYVVEGQDHPRRLDPARARLDALRRPSRSARPHLEQLGPSKGLHQVADHLHARQDAGLTTAFFTGKSKLRHIVPPGTVGVYERPGYYCKKVAEEAAGISGAPRSRRSPSSTSPTPTSSATPTAGCRAQADEGHRRRATSCLGILYEALEQGRHPRRHAHHRQRRPRRPQQGALAAPA